jgi:tetratricopeptide (TPR) repeat protein
VAVDGSVDTPRVILHEYLHQYSAYNFPPLPPWLDEGLAEFYSTFSATDRNAQVGRPVREHVLWLRQNKLIPLPRLFAVTQDDPEYNEEEKQGVFYAQSWALVHRLITGKPDRRAQINDYVNRLGRGESPKEALAALGDLSALEAELKAYVGQNAFTFSTHTFEEKALNLDVTFQAMPREDVLFRLGDLLLHTSELREDAAAHFEGALALAPAHAKALGGLALVEAENGRWDQAVAGFGQAVAAAPEDAELRLRLASALYQAEYESRSGQRVDQIPPRVLLAREHAAKAASLQPDHFDSQYLLGLTYTLQDKDVDPGIAALERAHDLAPGRYEVLVALGELQMRADRLADARQTFGEVVRRSTEADLVRDARRRLAEVTVRQAVIEAERTQNTAKAAATIRAALPDLDPEFRPQVEEILADLNRHAGTPGVAVPEVAKPALESTDLQAHLRYATQQANASSRSEGEASEALTSQALAHFRRAAEIDPASADAWFGLALSCLRTRCPAKEGVTSAEKGLALRQGDVWGSYLLANYRIEADRFDEAHALLRPLLDLEHPMRDELRSTEVRARIEEAQALTGKGKTEEALTVLENVTLPGGEQGKEAERWLAETRAGVQLRYWSDRLVEGSQARQSGQTDKARKLLQDIVARCPEKEIVQMAKQELGRLK